MTSQIFSSQTLSAASSLFVGYKAIGSLSTSLFGSESLKKRQDVLNAARTEGQSYIFETAKAIFGTDSITSRVANFVKAIALGLGSYVLYQSYSNKSDSDFEGLQKAGQVMTHREDIMSYLDQQEGIASMSASGISSYIDACYEQNLTDRALELCLKFANFMTKSETNLFEIKDAYYAISNQFNAHNQKLRKANDELKDQNKALLDANNSLDSRNKELQTTVNSLNVKLEKISQDSTQFKIASEQACQSKLQESSKHLKSECDKHLLDAKAQAETDCNQRIEKATSEAKSASEKTCEEKIAPINKKIKTLEAKQNEGIQKKEKKQTSETKQQQF